MDTTNSLQSRRERIVLDHFADETKQNFDAVLATFPHPRYEVIATGDLFDGQPDVRKYYAETRAAFPDQRHEIIQLRQYPFGGKSCKRFFPNASRTFDTCRLSRFTS